MLLTLKRQVDTDPKANTRENAPRVNAETGPQPTEQRPTRPSGRLSMEQEGPMQYTGPDHWSAILDELSLVKECIGNGMPQQSPTLECPNPTETPTEPYLLLGCTLR